MLFILLQAEIPALTASAAGCPHRRWSASLFVRTHSLHELGVGNWGLRIFAQRRDPLCHSLLSPQVSESGPEGRWPPALAEQAGTDHSLLLGEGHEEGLMPL